MAQYDFLLVGSGLFNSVFGYLARKEGKHVLIVERRSQLGGNLYCENMNGIQVHMYGPHIFHTNNRTVWNFVNSVVEFEQYTLNILANYKGRMFNLPFNMNTFYQLWGVNTPQEAMTMIEQQRKKLDKCCEHQNLEEYAKNFLGEDLYYLLVKGYTEKQWGKPCEELPSSILRRLPIRYTYNNNYFNDNWQGIPKGGYSNLISRLIDNIQYITECDYLKDRDYFNSLAKTIVYSGALDEFFDYRLGKLEYRSLRFEHEALAISNHQGNSIINYTDSDTAYTRTVEHKHFEPFNKEIQEMEYTVITREYPQAFNNDCEPYYPINDNKNEELCNKYKALAAKEKNVLFGGRLAEYKYYNMDEVVLSAINLFNSVMK